MVSFYASRYNIQKYYVIAHIVQLRVLWSSETNGDFFPTVHNSLTCIYIENWMSVLSSTTRILSILIM